MYEHSIELLHLQKAKENQFLAKGLTTIEDIAMYFPQKYYDFRTVTKVRNVVPDNFYALKGRVIGFKDKRNQHSLIVEEVGRFLPGYGDKFTVTWFNTTRYMKQFRVGEVYVFCGKVTKYYGKLYMSTPKAFGKQEDVCKIMPVYRKIRGMATDYLVKQIERAINFLKRCGRDEEKELFAKSLGLDEKIESLTEIHHPREPRWLEDAKRRITFDIIYDFYRSMKQRDICQNGMTNIAMNSQSAVRDAIKCLPFELTEDQSKTINTIIEEGISGRRIHSLISGDVGCGKTMIAILASIFAWENGLQTIVMAPTVVLAKQHYQEFLKYTDSLGIKIGILTSDTKKKERGQILELVRDGSLDILIGTHSVLNSEIEPKNLGLTIIDEEHKFGVKEKNSLTNYDKAGIHHLSMTATPIPRSIAMTIYGNKLAVLPIQTMPKGRKPVITRHCFSVQDAFQKIYEEIQAGHQAYIVCPFIDNSESEKFQNVLSVERVQNMAKNFFANKTTPTRIDTISGDMKQSEILKTVDRFQKGELDVLISTTIVEVGVNIPNATVIAVMSADRFGLATLHQLRGRVGRGAEQSYCLLCSLEKKERLDIMCSCTDGFEIAEKDMELRGPGDLNGEMQSGRSKEIETILTNPDLAVKIRERILGK